QEMATICAARHGPPEPDHVQRPNVPLRATLASRHIADPAVQLQPAVSVLAGRICVTPRQFKRRRCASRRKVPEPDFAFFSREGSGVKEARAMQGRRWVPVRQVLVMLAEEKRADLVSPILEMLAEQGAQLHAKDFTAALCSSGACRAWREACVLLMAMPAARVQANGFSFNAAISACEKSRQWQRALALFMAMPEAAVQADEITFNATISACEKSGEWQQALALFQAMPEATGRQIAHVCSTRAPETTGHFICIHTRPGKVASRCLQLQCLHQRLRESCALAACMGHVQGPVGGTGSSQRLQLLCDHLRLRQGWAVA
ncbi:unnamed protein product, partial [Effrenium voratum]